MIDTAAVIPQGRYLEDWTPGDYFISAGRTIKDADFRWFSNWVARPSGESMDTTHLMLAAMFLIQRLGKVEGTGVSNLGSQWRFRQPVRLDDTIWVRLTCVSARPSRSMSYCGIVSFTISVENQGGDVVADADWTCLVLRREGSDVDATVGQE